MGTKHIVAETSEVINGDDLLEAMRQGVKFVHKPALRPPENPDYSDVGEKITIHLECCDQCAPMIWTRGHKAKAAYTCNFCGKKVEHILVKKKIKKWW